MAISESDLSLSAQEETAASRLLLETALVQLSTLHFPEHVKMLPVQDVFDENWGRIANILQLDDTKLEELNIEFSALLERMVFCEWFSIATLDEDKRLIVCRPGGGSASLRGTTYAVLSNKTVTFQPTTVDQLIELFANEVLPIELSLADAATTANHKARELAEDYIG